MKIKIVQVKGDNINAVCRIYVTVNNIRDNAIIHINADNTAGNRYVLEATNSQINYFEISKEIAFIVDKAIEQMKQNRPLGVDIYWKWGDK